jgi:hypothetical protein
LVGFSPRKANLVLYLVGGVTDRYPKLLERLGPHRVGNGCLYLKRLDDVDRDVLQELVERTLRVHRGADRASGSRDRVSGRCGRRRLEESGTWVHRKP